MISKQSRALGSFVGLAVGDALGTTNEFTDATKPDFTPISDMIGGGTFKLQAGEWTDDTSLALALAYSLIEKHGFDEVDQLDKYLDWFENGAYSSNGRCFDIGNATRSALLRHKNREFMSQLYGRKQLGINSPGNGSIMRLAPIPIAYRTQKAIAIVMSAQSSTTTHRNLAACTACEIIGGFIWYCFEQQVPSKSEIMKSVNLLRPLKYLPDLYDDAFKPMTEGLWALTHNNHLEQLTREHVINPAGDVLSTLRAALWAFMNTNDFETGALSAVNLGGDADTVGAVYGQLAGAFYGYENIPSKWIDKLARKDELITIAGKLYDLCIE